VTTLVRHLDDAPAGSFAPSLDRYTTGQPRWLVTVGDGAVAQVGQAVVTGRPALALKTTVGAGYVGQLGPVKTAVDLVRSELGLGEDELSEEGEPSEENGPSGTDAAAGQRAPASSDDAPAPGDRSIDADEGTVEATGEASDAENFEHLPDSVVEELTEE
jgi:hypothetical protein